MSGLGIIWFLIPTLSALDSRGSLPGVGRAEPLREACILGSLPGVGRLRSPTSARHNECEFRQLLNLTHEMGMIMCCRNLWLFVLRECALILGHYKLYVLLRHNKHATIQNLLRMARFHLGLHRRIMEIGLAIRYCRHCLCLAFVSASFVVPLQRNKTVDVNPPCVVTKLHDSYETIESKLEACLSTT